MKPTILLIEDDLISALLVELQLGHEGYEVLTAPNGVEGLNMVRAHHPSLILLDLMLPGVDGFNILDRLQADPETTDVPVIVISALTRETDRRTAAELGARAYLTKPYEMAELLDLVASALTELPAEGGAGDAG